MEINVDKFGEKEVKIMDEGMVFFMFLSGLVMVLVFWGSLEKLV